MVSLSIIILFVLYALQRQTQPDTLGALIAAPSTTTTAEPTSAVPRLPKQVTRAPATRSAVSVAATVATTTRSSTSTPTSVSAAPTNLPKTSFPTPTATAAKTTGEYIDGTYVGNEADANWGLVQVQIVVEAGAVTDVHVLEFPNHRNRSQEINAQAIPLLTSEAIRAQSGRVDVISGATDTSYGFIESLGSALSQATR